MAKFNDFQGFRFGNIHSSDLNLVVVSSSNRYDKNLLPSPSDYDVNIPGGDGKYYFGQTFNTRDFTVNVAFDNVSEPTFRKISQLFATDKLQDLVFDELPYKTYRAKLKSAPDFKHICFVNKETGERTYKGEGTLHFICYQPYAYCFNKYVVRAADYYKQMPPELIITNSIEENPYLRRAPKKLLPGLIKDHYNVRPNMNTPWKGGYPTIEQAQWGELYFKDPKINATNESSSEAENDAKLLIDVRGYWKNVPSWEGTAQLLTTPTLDFDQELIFMPQYNKINFMNMETGLNNEQGLIGSRILVYNPGDIPVEFELKMDNVKKFFRGQEGAYSFRVNRYNVQRLNIVDAVDWTGLTTKDLTENESYKYGNRYFKILEPVYDNGKKVDVTYRTLKCAHPHHCYMVEPIPREKLAYYIKLFYWQSYQLKLISEEEWHQGIDIANRYQELYNGCITDEERYELYWQTLKDAILYKYGEKEEFDDDAARETFMNNLTNSYFHHPPEYIKINKTWENFYGREYGQVDFNLSRLPIYITEDYIQLNSAALQDEDVTESSEKEVNKSIPHSLFLDSDRRMVYNINEPEWKNCKGWLDDNAIKQDNFYNFKPTKTIRNEAIEEGHWFKIPPGWSLISIEPVVDENRWGGKLWRDARPFVWGEVDSSKRREFYTIYYKAMRDYVSGNCPQPILNQLNNGDVPNWDELSDTEVEQYGQFRRWFGEDEDFYGDYNDKTSFIEGCEPVIDKHSIQSDLVHKMNEDAEYEFLKLLGAYWNVMHLDENGRIPNDESIDAWWWEASNYMWANFPPLYWGYMDLCNRLQIKYVPLFY